VKADLGFGQGGLEFEAVWAEFCLGEYQIRLIEKFSVQA